MLCAGLLITGQVDVARHTEAWLDLEVGCRVGDVARDRTCPFATRPPATLLSTRFACAQGKGMTGRGGGGGCTAMGACDWAHSPFSAAPCEVRIPRIEVV